MTIKVMLNVEAMYHRKVNVKLLETIPIASITIWMVNNYPDNKNIYFSPTSQYHPGTWLGIITKPRP